MQFGPSLVTGQLYYFASYIISSRHAHWEYDISIALSTLMLQPTTEVEPYLSDDTFLRMGRTGKENLTHAS